jgi:Tfp pilus assembly protein PilF
MNTAAGNPALSEVERGALFDRAVELADDGDLVRAADLLRALVMHAPEDVGAWRALAECHERQGQVRVAWSLRGLADLI